MKNGLEILDKARDYVIESIPVKKEQIIFDSSLSCEYGNTENKFTETVNSVEFTIGIKEIANNNISYNELMSISAVISLFHECFGHGCQVLYEYQNKRLLSRILTINTFACECALYYKENPLKEYFNQPSEIAAQYSGIKKAFEFYKKELSQNEAETLICYYVNERIRQNKDQFISYENLKTKEFNSLEEILQAFNQEFICQIYSKRNKFWCDNSPVINILKWIKSQNEAKYDKLFKHLYVYTNNGMYQDKILAEMYFTECNQKEVIEKIPALDELKAFDNYFNADFTKSPKPLWILFKIKNVNLKNLLYENLN